MTSACLTLWPGALTVRARVLQDATGDGYPDGDEDQATDQLAALAGLGAEPVPQLSPTRDKVTLTTPMMTAAAARLTW
jgi:hypothetical protein